MGTFLGLYILAVIINVLFFRFVLDKPNDMDESALRVLGVFFPFINVIIAFVFSVITIFYGLNLIVNGKSKF